MHLGHPVHIRQLMISNRNTVNTKFIFRYLIYLVIVLLFAGKLLILLKVCIVKSLFNSNSSSNNRDILQTRTMFLIPLFPVVLCELSISHTLACT